jgi:hypothetical protein
MAGMSKALSPPLPAARPTLLDYFLLLAGCALSLFLMGLGPLYVEAKPDVTSAAGRALVEALPSPMRLTEGVVLLWPLFFFVQWAAGRQEGLTAAEWLWVIAWLGVALLTGLSAWERWGSLPEWMRWLTEKYHPRHVWYLIFVPSLGVLALLFLLASVAVPRPRPWTHTFSIALATWPALPLAGIVAFGKFV